MIMTKSVLKIIIKLIIIIAFFLTFFSSCVEDRVDVNKLVFNHHNSVKYTVQAQITNSVSKHYVHIGRFAKVGASIKDNGVKGAHVVINDGKRDFAFREVVKDDHPYDENFRSGFYESVDYFRGEPNKIYRLDITIGDKIYSATEIMPEPEDITNAELSLLGNSNESWFFGQEKTAIFFDGERNRDRIVFVLSDGLLSFERLRPESSFSSSSIIDPIGEKIKYPSSFRDKGPTRIMYRYTLSEGYKDYMWGYLSQTTWNYEDLVSTEPGNLKSNFDSPEIIGYFSAISHRSYHRLTSKPYPIDLYKTEKVFTTHYKDKGNFKITFYPWGTCELEGLGLSMRGAYEIRDFSFYKERWQNNWNYVVKEETSKEKYSGKTILMHFAADYREKAPELYEFYYSNLGIMSNAGYELSPKMDISEVIGFINVNPNTIESHRSQLWTIQ